MVPGVAFCEPRVSTVCLRAQKLLVDEGIENRAACHPLDSAKTMHLIGREAQTRHFEELGAETLEDRLHMTSLSDLRQRTERLHFKPRRRRETRAMWADPARRLVSAAASLPRPMSE
jgi:hypothetical protein